MNTNRNQKYEKSDRHKMTVFFLFGNCLNFGVNNLNLMTQARKPGRPREWVLNEEIIEVHRLATELKTKNPQIHWSNIESMLKKQLEQNQRKDLLSKIDKIIGLMKQVIPTPPDASVGTGCILTLTTKWRMKWSITGKSSLDA
jgi:hypothetical protein